MYSITDLKGMLFLDIETSTLAKDLDGYAKAIGDNGKEHWKKKSKWVRKNSPEYIELDDDRLYQLDAALYPEFGRVVCVSIGQVVFEDGVTPTAKIKSFYGDNEKDILDVFMKTMSRIFHANPKISLVGHNVKGFDLPFLIKRAIINRIPKDVLYNSTDLMQALIESGNKLVSYPTHLYWLDIGKHEDLEQAQEDIKQIKF